MGTLTPMSILDILKVGVSGFCFLLALMGYRLLRAEQMRPSPREKLLKNIRFFLWMSLALGVLVAVSPLVSSTRPSAPEGMDSGGATYVTDETTYVIDFTRWKPVADGVKEKVSPVTIMRRDKIRKVKPAHESYVLPFYTTGAAIDYKPIRYPVEPTYEQVSAPEDSPNLKAFQYTLPLDSEPSGFTTELVNRFIFWNGFRDPGKEWWTASVKYPTARLTIIFRFPDEKPCTMIEARLRKGQAKQQLITDNPPSRTDDGLYAFWSGERLAAETRVYFQFSW
jgi:hypothetical protein